MYERIRFAIIDVDGRHLAAFPRTDWAGCRNIVKVDEEKGRFYLLNCRESSIWEIALDGSVTDVIPCPGLPRLPDEDKFYEFSPGLSRVAYMDGPALRLHDLNAKTDECILNADNGIDLADMKWLSEDRLLLAFGSSHDRALDGRIMQVQLPQKQLQVLYVPTSKRMSGIAARSGVSLSPDRRYLAFVDLVGGEGHLKVLDLRSGQTMEMDRVVGFAGGCWHPSEHIIAYENKYGCLTEYSLEEKRPMELSGATVRGLMTRIMFVGNDRLAYMMDGGEFGKTSLVLLNTKSGETEAVFKKKSWSEVCPLHRSNKIICSWVEWYNAEH